MQLMKFFPINNLIRLKYYIKFVLIIWVFIFGGKYEDNREKNITNITL